jgi:biotin synthase
MGMEVCCGGIIGMGESLEQRAEFAARLAELAPDEVPMNFLDPRPEPRSPSWR